MTRLLLAAMLVALWGQAAHADPPVHVGQMVDDIFTCDPLSPRRPPATALERSAGQGETVLPAGTVIPFVFDALIRADRIRRGDCVGIFVAEDVRVNGRIVAYANMTGFAQVTELRRRSGRRPARITLVPRLIRLGDIAAELRGSPITLSAVPAHFRGRDEVYEPVVVSVLPEHDPGPPSPAAR